MCQNNGPIQRHHPLRQTQQLNDTTISRIKCRKKRNYLNFLLKYFRGNQDNEEDYPNSMYHRGSRKRPYDMSTYDDYDDIPLYRPMRRG